MKDKIVFEPASLLVAGDLHGDPQYTAYIYQKALDVGADAIIQCGDFGYWEHMPGGDAFLDFCAALADQHALPLFWVDGNHENHTLLRKVYGPGGEKHKPTPEGFWEIRPGVYYIPRGTRWTWSDHKMMGLGGAYSVDKFIRLDDQQKKLRDHEESNRYRRAAGRSSRPFNAYRWQLWWPEEELTDDEIAVALASDEPIDVLFTHDKPRGSNPQWNRKDIPDCWPNQDKISAVVNALKPKLLFHGHLHFRYRDHIPCGEDQYTQVEGLNCNTNARMGNDMDPETGWAVLILRDLQHDDEEDVID